MASLQQEIKESGGSAHEAAKEHINASKDSASSAKDRTIDTAQQQAGVDQSGAASADQSGGVLQQTGERVKSMAQGAVDTVKNTLGAGSAAPEKK